MPLLDIRQLKGRFMAPDGERHSVVDIESFSLAEKAQVALSGESGSGKTTFLHLIAGILKPDSGTIMLAGREMSALPEAARDRLRATTIGYIFQTFNLLQGYTCLENVLLGMSFGPGADREFAQGLLEKVGLGSRLHHRGHASYPPDSNSAWRWPARLPTAPNWCWRTNPPATLTIRTLANRWILIRAACQENGAALLLVSHDRDVLGGFEQVHSLEKLNRAAATRETMP